MTAPDGGPSALTADRDQLLVDLGTHLRLLGQRIDGVRHAASSTVMQLQPQLTDVQAELGLLRGEVTGLRTSQPQITTVPVNWPTLPTVAAEAAWEALGQWVQEVLGGWCEVTRDQLPDCWALHRPALMQVSWLWTSHTEAYQPHSRSHAAAEWNTRWLDAALDKIKKVIPASQCRPLADQPGQHLVHGLDAQQHHDRKLRQHASYALYSDTTSTPDPRRPDLTPPRAGVISSPGQQTIHKEFWQPYFEQAMQTDLAARRRRDGGQ
jgi:hypothetical protein